ncbi:MAG: membrane dipeptidase [Planctomycetota bacterium]
MTMRLFDAHLDLAWNATQRGRDVTTHASDQPYVDNETATVGLPDLCDGGVGGVCATLFADPDHDTPVHAQAIEQLVWYANCPGLHVVRGPEDLDRTDVLPAVLLMEGADPIRGVEDVAWWFGRGLRMVGLAWSATRYAGGTGHPGPLTDAGHALVAEFDRLGILHDASHLAEQSLDDLLDATDGPICASHSNCRAIVGDDPRGRQLPDRQIRAILERGGIIGTVFFDRFLLPEAEHGKRRATLADVVAHISRVCDLAGNTTQAGIGTDMDGGRGREHIPKEIATSADLPKLADALTDAGFCDRAIAGIMGENWRSWFKRHLR